MAQARSRQGSGNGNRTERIRLYLGAWSAVSVLQFFAAEAATIARWAGPAPYSRRLGFISDLGQVGCGLHGTRDICSPLHALMDFSFVLQGIGMVIAALLLTSPVLRVAAEWPAVLAERRLTAALVRTTPSPASHAKVAVPRLATLAVRLLLGAAGIGVAVVGLFPQDSVEAVHLAGATAYFLGGSSALVVLGLLWLRRTAAAWPVLLLGATALTSTLVGGALQMRVPEPGTLERLMGYPVTIGIAIVGAVLAWRLGVPSRAARALARAARA
ncbi:DUF998 domain-containing protein [Sinomonas flava]|uniref:ABC-2 type transport system permease protein n=1 Tax=Sinomonas flava TaxID=496857 RepID=A0ABP5NSF8_9MICC